MINESVHSPKANIAEIGENEQEQEINGETVVEYGPTRLCLSKSGVQSE